MSPIVKVQLTYEELRGLEEMAMRNLRLPALQLRWLLQEALRSLPSAPVEEEAPEGKMSATPPPAATE